VKVSASTWLASASPVATRQAIRRVSTRVLPDPAGARMASGRAGDVTARRWASSRSWSRWSATAGDSIRARTIPAVIDLPRDRFDTLVGDALDGIPDELARYIDNVAVVVEEGSPRSGLLGRYVGVPLTERGAGYGLGVSMPDRITIFRLPICARCTTEDEVVEQVTITVVHEVAHHFGIDDRRLAELGWA
jgi:predicted Zn-dependent protease with MMP-like domain